jgi:hypothetical protein
MTVFEKKNLVSSMQQQHGKGMRIFPLGNSGFLQNFALSGFPQSFLKKKQITFILG